MKFKIPALLSIISVALVSFSIAMAVAFNIGDATLSETTFDHSAQLADSRGISFANDGLKLYIGGFDGEIYQYTLSTAFDLSTASYDSKMIDLPQVGSSGLQEFVVSNDGTKLLALEFYDRRIYEYDLTTDYDISTATYANNSLFISEGLNNYSFSAKPDGTKLYVHSDFNDEVYQYTLSTPWDTSTASYDSVSYSVPNFSDGQVLAFHLAADGENAYFLSSTSDRSHWFTLGTAWDISTLSNESTSYSFNSTDYYILSLFAKSDGSSLFAANLTGNAIVELVMSGAASSSSSNKVSPINIPSAEVVIHDARYCNGSSTIDFSITNPVNVSKWMYTFYDDASTYSDWMHTSTDTYSFGFDGDVTGQTLFVKIASDSSVHRFVQKEISDVSFCETIDIEENIDEEEEDPEPILEPNTLVRGSSNNAVYFITEEGTRRPFTSKEILETYTDLSDALIVSDELLAEMPLGRPMLPKHTESLIEMKYHEGTYAITKEDKPLLCALDSSCSDHLNVPIKEAIVFRLDEVLFGWLFR